MPSKRGSRLSDKQIAKTVLDGAILHFTLTSGEKFSGYVCGVDDFHWMVVTSEVEVSLVHKGRAERIRIGKHLYDGEANHAELEKIVGPFRAYLSKAKTEQDVPSARQHTRV